MYSLESEKSDVRVKAQLMKSIIFSDEKIIFYDYIRISPKSLYYLVRLLLAIVAPETKNRKFREVGMGPSIKYVTLQGGGGLRKCDSLWQGRWRVKIMWRHTVSFFTIHNF